MSITSLNKFINQSDDTIFLKGKIVIETVSIIAKYYQDIDIFKHITTLDLKDISQLDSSLLALLVEYRKLKPDLKIINPPKSLIQLMNAYQLHDFL